MARFYRGDDTWCKACLAICAAFAVFSSSPAKALLADGSYIIELTGTQIDPSPGTFDVMGPNIENFSLDLLSGGVSANASSLYLETLLSNDPAGLTMFSGAASNVSSFGDIIFLNTGDWGCTSIAFGACNTSNDFLFQLSGTYSITQVSAVPLPAAIWLFIAALGGLGLFGWRSRNPAAA